MNGRFNRSSSSRGGQSSQGFYGNRSSSDRNRSFRARRIKTIDVSLLVKKSIQTAPQEAYIPVHAFSDFLIGDVLKQNIISRGYVSPTPIQDQVIEPVLEGKDIVGIANTGTGKTAAFLIPLLNKIYFNRSHKILIIAPTRELAVQIQQEADAFTKGMKIFSQLCIGGVPMFRQIQGVRRNPAIVIGTPGRLKDLKNQGVLKLSEYRTVVLDEVDRMLDMGFINDVKFLIAALPLERQSLFFSATLSPEISQVIQTFVRNPITISVKSQETALNVDQDIIRTNGRSKLDVLHDLLRREEVKKVLIFGRTKWGIEKLAKQLIERGFFLMSLHGNKNQNQRQRALEQFKSDKISILLATDIASRGLDIADVTHVINYDLPETYEDYVHRIGRTGRADKKGIALSFIE